VADFRSQRMPTPEGAGNAASRWRQAWDAYARGVNKVARPLTEPAIEPIARKAPSVAVEDLAGFWLLWHLEGGFEGLQRIGLSRSGIYRRVSAFRAVYGEHPDSFQFPGVTVDVGGYIRAVRAGEAKASAQ
jgi:hypothetical protein